MRNLFLENHRKIVMTNSMLPVLQALDSATTSA